MRGTRPTLYIGFKFEFFRIFFEFFWIQTALSNVHMPQPIRARHVSVNSATNGSLPRSRQRSPRRPIRARHATLARALAHPASARRIRLANSAALSRQRGEMQANSPPVRGRAANRPRRPSRRRFRRLRANSPGDCRANTPRWSQP
jgi:hypothetical protein